MSYIYRVTQRSLATHLIVRQAITSAVMWIALWSIELIIPIFQLSAHTRSSLAISLSAGWTLTWCQTSGLARALEDLGLRIRRAQRVIWGVTALASLGWALSALLMTTVELHTLKLTIPHGSGDEAEVELCVSSSSGSSAQECVTQPWRIPDELKRATPEEQTRYLRRSMRVERPSGARVEITPSDAALVYRATAQSREGASRITSVWLAHLSLALLFGLWLGLGYAPRVSLMVYIGVSLALEALGSAVL